MRGLGLQRAVPGGDAAVEHRRLVARDAQQPHQPRRDHAALVVVGHDRVGVADPQLPIPRANTSGSGSGWRPACGHAGAASQSSSSTNTAPGRWPRSYSARPGRPSRYQRTSASTTSSRWAAVHAASTTGAIIESGTPRRASAARTRTTPGGPRGGAAGAPPGPQAPLPSPCWARSTLSQTRSRGHEVGGVAGGVEVLARPAAGGQLDVRAALDPKPAPAAPVSSPSAPASGCRSPAASRSRRPELVDGQREAADAGGRARVGVGLPRPEAEPLEPAERGRQRHAVPSRGSGNGQSPAGSTATRHRARRPRRSR